MGGKRRQQRDTGSTSEHRTSGHSPAGQSTAQPGDRSHRQESVAHGRAKHLWQSTGKRSAAPVTDGIAGQRTEHKRAQAQRSTRSVRDLLAWCPMHHFGRHGAPRRGSAIAAAQGKGSVRIPRWAGSLRCAWGGCGQLGGCRRGHSYDDLSKGNRISPRPAGRYQHGSGHRKCVRAAQKVR